MLQFLHLNELSLKKGRKLLSYFRCIFFILPQDYSRSKEPLRKHLALPQIIQCGKIKKARHSSESQGGAQAQFAWKKEEGEATGIQSTESHFVT